MLSSPAKRRKLSPPNDPVAIPDALKRPPAPENAQSRSSRSENKKESNSPFSPSKSQRRASFQSPTKASLARFNPALIPASSRKQPAPSPSRTTPAISTLTPRITRSTRRTDGSSRPSLVQQVLGARRTSEHTATALDTGTSLVTPAATQDDGNENAQDERPTTEKEGFSAAVTKAFNAVPANQTTLRQPLRPRQPSGIIPTPDNSQDVDAQAIPSQTQNEQSSKGDPAYQRLPPARVSSLNNEEEEELFRLLTNGHRNRTPENEPELPPTPIQLGVLAPPERPRGLDSLSSSGRRRRFRDGLEKKTSPLKPRMSGERATTSSPLKQKSKEVLPQDVRQSNKAKSRQPDSIDTDARTSLPATDNANKSQRRFVRAETPASGLSSAHEERSSGPNAEDYSNIQEPSNEEQATLLSSLKFQLNNLQLDLSKLEALVNENEVMDESSQNLAEPLDFTIVSLLTTLNASCEPSPHERDEGTQKTLHQEIREYFRASVDAGPDPKPFLSLFMPGNLRLETRTKVTMKNPNGSKRVNGNLRPRAHVLHQIDLAAPSPFPSHTFSAQLEVLTDPEECAIKAIKVLQLGRGLSGSKLKGFRRKHSSHEASDMSLWKSPLGRWISNRLTPGSLHERDIGGLVVGIGHWWNAASERAHCFATLVRHLSGQQKGGVQDTPLRPYDLLPYLFDDGIVFNVEGPMNAMTDERKRVPIHLSYSLSLDWTSEVDTDISISIGGVDAKAEAELKNVFVMLMQKKKVGKYGMDNDIDATWKRAVDAVLGVVDLIGGQRRK
ncbi:MAG: hypothetical protein Q9227_009209 [Pyrenula ochraceoflavens]